MELKLKLESRMNSFRQTWAQHVGSLVGVAPTPFELLCFHVLTSVTKPLDTRLHKLHCIQVAIPLQPEQARPGEIQASYSF